MRQVKLSLEKSAPLWETGACWVVGIANSAEPMPWDPSGKWEQRFGGFNLLQGSIRLVRSR